MLSEWTNRISLQGVYTNKTSHLYDMKCSASDWANYLNQTYQRACNGQVVGGIRGRRFTGDRLWLLPAASWMNTLWSSVNYLNIRAGIWYSWTRNLISNVSLARHGASLNEITTLAEHWHRQQKSETRFLSNTIRAPIVWEYYIKLWLGRAWLYYVPKITSCRFCTNHWQWGELLVDVYKADGNTGSVWQDDATWTFLIATRRILATEVSICYGNLLIQS